MEPKMVDTLPVDAYNALRIMAGDAYEVQTITMANGKPLFRVSFTDPEMTCRYWVDGQWITITEILEKVGATKPAS